jgi:hypothetical protein
MTTDLESFRRRESPECLSDLQLDCILAGEENAQTVAYRRHLETCRSCANRLQAQSDATASFPERIDLPGLSVKTLDQAENAEPSRRVISRRPWLVLAPVAAAVAGLLLFVTIGNQTLPGPGGDPGATRTKGKVGFGVVVKRGGRVFAGESGGIYHPGDRLRFHSNSTDVMHLSIFNIESSGKLVRFIPVEGNHSIRVRPGRKVLLPGAIELDKSLGEEILVGVFCREDYRLERALTALSKWDRRKETLDQRLEDIGGDCKGQSLVMHKQEQAR